MYTVHILIYNIYIYCISAVVTAILDLNCPLVSWRVIHLSQFISGHYFCTSVCGGPGGGGAGRTKKSLVVPCSRDGRTSGNRKEVMKTCVTRQGRHTS